MGLVQGGAWDVVGMLTVVFNINHGPWKTAAWLAQSSEAGKEYFSTFSSPTCDLCLDYLQAIASDLGREDEIHQPGAAEGYGRWQDNIQGCT